MLSFSKLSEAKLVFYVCLSNVDKHTSTSDVEHINSEMLYYYLRELLFP